MEPYELVLISGVSGSGKSTALKAFEDIGYFRIDNLPASMINHFVDFLIAESSSVGALSQERPLFSAAARKFALLLHFRDSQSYSCVKKAVARLRKTGATVSLIFFDCQDEVVVRRFQETRRPHPLLVAGKLEGTIIEALTKERELLADFRDEADKVLDTSSYSPHDLRRIIEDYADYTSCLQASVFSFGFKYGVPHDADLIVDVRFLPNPHFVAELREKTGLDPEVAEHVFQSKDAEVFLKHYLSLLEFLLPRYQQEGKRYLNIAVGCTGGRHRSVAISERLAVELGQFIDKDNISVRHRDLVKEG